MSSKYKLIYFEYTGFGEPIRYLFAYANQPYEDIRIKKADWPEFKKTTPFGKLPYLEIDGKVINQSGAILRYLARKFKLIGDSEEVAFQADALLESLKDLQQLILKFYYEEDAAKKEEIKKKLLDEDFPYYLKKFDAIISKNGGILVGKKLTYADLVFAAILSTNEGAFPGFFKPYPALNGLIEKVHNLPAIKKWLQERPANNI